MASYSSLATLVVSSVSSRRCFLPLWDGDDDSTDAADRLLDEADDDDDGGGGTAGATRVSGAEEAMDEVVVDGAIGTNTADDDNGVGVVDVTNVFVSVLGGGLSGPADVALLAIVVFVVGAGGGLPERFAGVLLCRSYSNRYN